MSEHNIKKIFSNWEQFIQKDPNQLSRKYTTLQEQAAAAGDHDDVGPEPKMSTIAAVEKLGNLRRLFIVLRQNLNDAEGDEERLGTVTGDVAMGRLMKEIGLTHGKKLTFVDLFVAIYKSLPVLEDAMKASASAEATRAANEARNSFLRLFNKKAPFYLSTSTRRTLASAENKLKNKYKDVHGDKGMRHARKRIAIFRDQAEDSSDERDGQISYYLKKLRHELTVVTSGGDKLSVAAFTKKSTGGDADVVPAAQGDDEDGGEDTQQPTPSVGAVNRPKKARITPKKAVAAAAPATGEDAEIVSAVRAKQGSRGSLSGADEMVILKVAELQRLLVDIGLLPAGGVDGIFGSQTARATRNAYYDQT